MTSALLSWRNRCRRRRVAMTDEQALTGRNLPISEFAEIDRRANARKID